ncbi:MULTISPECIES: SDR family oxidoreductase [unclassified Nocardioides]|uniref:SDR family oxidoreductase n=1 Tax=unclassified Nocardioides TaxID=2615069 RepID=UPI0006F43D09|nr:MULTISPECIES: SDR family oxidoreductase [unclassified Nocardioides]KQY57567.1 short-chain dehydrogenase [Nocardioides sp. Root140]KQZ76064.1 short-chain dehydrogenase [Nocardioides sp. Root151]KRF15137.1 short-chain dehydrogenase [Nocardioides sp. Soil796]
MTLPVLFILGAGPGLGRAVAHRFHNDGYKIVLAARSEHRLGQLADDLRGAGTKVDTVAVDLTDEKAVRRAVDEVGRRHGHIDVLHFNPSTFRQKDPLALTVDELLDDLRLGVAPLLPAVQAARPYLRSGARVVVTGSAAADKPWNQAASLGVQKAALRNLVISLDTTLEPDGIRAVNVQVDGVLAQSGTFGPGNVATAIHAAVVRRDAEWTPLVHYPG